ncbi:hypothetical protein LUZ60_000167 [Juncus effusus]|nr:hypothetical protein LUZ60_000167 [Juncus effusus]
MAVRSTLLLSLLLLVSVLSATSSSPSLFNTLAMPPSPPSTASNTNTVYPMRCRGFTANCYDDIKVAGFGLEEAVRRGLAGGVRYISYEALKKDRVPCNRRGNSYYNCMRTTRANPYRRGCSIITRCKKIYD